MKVKLLTAFLFISIATSAQYTLIPDINFEKKLIALNIDSGTPDGKVLTDNIKSVEYLNVQYSNISSLAGIESFANLISLECSYNQLTILDVSKNPALLYLTCQNNKLTTLDVSKNNVLESLWCSFNQLTTLDVSNNPALAGFNCSFNQLTTLDVSKNTALINLDCGVNLLTSLDVSKNTVLKTLSCLDNKLIIISFPNITALTSLVCYNNKLITLDVSKNTALTYLDCMGNNLTTLDVSKNTALTTLYCGDNGLTTLDVSQITALKYLFCYNNQIATLDLSKDTALESLACNNNSLTSLNLKNGANKQLSHSSSFTHNPNLSCIQVDDQAYADANWLPFKDATARFVNDCTNFVLGTTAVVFEKMSIYPNPSKGELHMDNVNLKNATVYDASGKTVKSAGFDNASDKNTMNLSGIAKGVYYIFIEAEGAQTTEKIIIE